MLVVLIMCILGLCDVVGIEPICIVGIVMASLTIADKIVKEISEEL